MENVIIESVSLNKGWFNIKDSTGREISVMQEKNPKISPLLEKAKKDDVIEMDIAKKGDKFYGWDPKEKKDEKKFAPKDKSYDAAIAASYATGQMLSLTKDAGKDKFDELFEHIHSKIMSKVTK